MLTREIRKRMKHQFRERRAKIPGKGKRYYETNLKGLTQAYQAKLYLIKFRLDKKEIARNLKIPMSKLYELLRKFGDL